MYRILTDALALDKAEVQLLTEMLDDLGDKLCIKLNPEYVHEEMEQTNWTNCCMDGTVFQRTPMGQANMNHVSECEQDWSQDSGPALSM